jgi:uncharacterized tellurite resistance protein B-like protein
MFVQHLNPEQRRALVILAYYVMVADHKVTPEEEALIDALEHELNISPVDPGEMLVEPVFALFTDRQAKLALMLKLTAVAHVDRVLHPAEAAQLQDYGARLNLSAEDMADIDRYGRLHAELVALAHKLQGQ